jgi:hypothetical protein
MVHFQERLYKKVYLDMAWELEVNDTIDTMMARPSNWTYTFYEHYKYFTSTGAEKILYLLFDQWHCAQSQ